MYGQLPKVKTEDGKEIEAFPVSIKYPKKIAFLRLPTSEEIIPFLNSQRTIVKTLGRGKSVSEDKNNVRAEATLFKLLRLDNGEEFDEAEMRKALGEISFHRMLSCLHDGDLFVVTLATPLDDKDDNGERIPIVHTLRMPKASEAERYRKFIMSPVDLPDGMQEQRYPVQVPAELFDAIIQSSAGYAPGTAVPIHHKRTVINSLMYKLGLEEQDATDPN
jgi:hypothetical protein